MDGVIVSVSQWTLGDSGGEIMSVVRVDEEDWGM